MDYIDKAKLRALLYRVNCGLLFDRVFNASGFDLSVDDVYSRHIDSDIMSETEYDLLICKPTANDLFCELWSTNHLIIILGYDKNNKLILNEYGNK